MNDYFKQRLLDKNDQARYNGSESSMQFKNPHVKFIAFSGKKQVGKDTAAQILTSYLTSQGLRVTTTSFASPLKKLCVEILGLKPEGVYGTDDQKNQLSHIMWDGFSEEIRLKYSRQVTYVVENNIAREDKWLPQSGLMTNREVLQVIGTDVFREIYGDVWALAPFNADWSQYDVVIFTDCRFPNEKQAVELHNGLVIRLKRDTGFCDTHSSETALDNVGFDKVYVNNGSVQDLKEYIEGVASNLI